MPAKEARASRAVGTIRPPGRLGEQRPCLPKPDPVLVANIAESIKVFGAIHPIAARLHSPGWGKKDETWLIAGLARLDAHKLAGEATVPCTYFADDDAVAEFVRRSENLFRKKTQSTCRH